MRDILKSILKEYLGEGLYKQLDKELKNYRFDAIEEINELFVEKIVVEMDKAWINQRTNIRNIALKSGVFV